MIKIKKMKVVKNNKLIPLPDIAISECGWEGDISECIITEDGDWENGYYMSWTCPECGEYIDNWEMSEERALEFEEWIKDRGKN